MVTMSVEMTQEEREAYKKSCKERSDRSTHIGFMCGARAKAIIADLKKALPEFAKDVNAEPNYDKYEGVCKAYVEVISKHIPIENFYTQEDIKYGYAIARDTLYRLASNDPEYNGKSGYGDFCDANAQFRPSGTCVYPVDVAKALSTSIELAMNGDKKNEEFYGDEVIYDDEPVAEQFPIQVEESVNSTVGTDESGSILL